MIEKYGKEHILFTLGYASGEPNYSNELPSGLDADSLVQEALKVAPCSSEASTKTFNKIAKAMTAGAWTCLSDKTS